MRTHQLLILVTTVLWVVSARNLCAQDPMAKWKPSVGDRFVYLYQWEEVDYWHGAPSITRSGSDTLTMEILNIDSSFNASYLHVVSVRNSSAKLKNSSKALYYFHSGSNISSKHPFAIDIGDSLCTDCTTGYDFSTAADTQVTYQSNPLTVFSFEHDSIVSKGSASGSIKKAALYSPAFKWLYSLNASDDEPPPDFTYTASSSSSTLISATTILSKVEQQHVRGNAPMTIEQGANFITITFHEAVGRPFTISLLDPLARPIRSWHMPLQPGEQRIILNVADVPSGIYFLMLDTPGNGEVRKIAIVR